MELAKIRNLSDEELKHQEKTSAEQLFRIRFQVAMGQSDGVKKLRQLRKEIAQIKTVTRERELSIHGENKEVKQATPAAEAETPGAKEAAAEVEAKAEKVEQAAPAAETKTRKTKKAAPAAAAKKPKKEKTKGARK
jgi:large subunit ribosomal protein L29